MNAPSINAALDDAAAEGAQFEQQVPPPQQQPQLLPPADEDVPMLGGNLLSVPAMVHQMQRSPMSTRISSANAPSQREEGTGSVRRGKERRSAVE